jgi:hypothetical protein
MSYYNGTRTHLSLNKDAPMSRAAETAGRILCRPILGGLHHHTPGFEFATGTAVRLPHGSIAWYNFRMSADEAFLRHLLSGIVLRPEQMPI